jgi:hypothetical protein
MIDKINELINISSSRDEVFLSILNTFSNKSVNIFQIGAIETLDNYLFRIGSGWSDIVFGNYIKKNGGTFTIADISLDHLAHSNLIASQLGYNVNLCYGNGLDHITPEYNIYYLDGSIDPAETKNQFDKILSFNLKDIYICVDDFSIKGTTIDLSIYPFKIHKIEKGLGVLHYHG